MFRSGALSFTGQVIECEQVVNCAGMWARQLGEKNGVCIPNQAAEHYYLITEPMTAVDPSWPVIEDPSSHTYIRPEGGGLMVGLFEPEAAAWNCKVCSSGTVSRSDDVSPFISVFYCANIMCNVSHSRKSRATFPLARSLRTWTAWLPLWRKPCSACLPAVTPASRPSSAAPSLSRPISLPSVGRHLS